MSESVYAFVSIKRPNVLLHFLTGHDGKEMQQHIGPLHFLTVMSGRCGAGGEMCDTRWARCRLGARVPVEYLRGPVPQGHHLLTGAGVRSGQPYNRITPLLTAGGWGGMVRSG